MPIRPTLLSILLVLAAGCGGARTVADEVEAGTVYRGTAALSAAAPIYGALAAHLDAADPPADVTAAWALLEASSRRFPPVLRGLPAGEGAAAVRIPGTARPDEEVVLAAVGGVEAGRLAALARATGEAIRGGDLAFPVRSLTFVAAADTSALAAALARHAPPYALLVLCEACGAGDTLAPFTGPAPFLATFVGALRGVAIPTEVRAPLTLPFTVPTYALGPVAGEEATRPLLVAGAAAYAVSSPSRALLEQGAEVLLRTAERRLPTGGEAARRAWWAWHHRGADELLALALPHQRPALAAVVLRVQAALRHARDASPAGGSSGAAGSGSAPAG